jgi:hypothetical protein
MRVLSIEKLEETGVSRASIWLTQTEGAAAIVEMAVIARQVLPS